MNYARIINSVAVDVSTDPANQFHPTIAAEFTQVPDDVVRGSTLVDGAWQAPVPYIEPEPEPEPEVIPEPEPEVVPEPTFKQVSPVEFKLLFTADERIAISNARETDVYIQDFFTIVDDLRLKEVNLGLKSTQDGIGYLALKGLIAPERVDEILSGELK